MDRSNDHNAPSSFNVSEKFLSFVLSNRKKEPHSTAAHLLAYWTFVESIHAAVKQPPVPWSTCTFQLLCPLLCQLFHDPLQVSVQVPVGRVHLHIYLNLKSTRNKRTGKATIGKVGSTETGERWRLRLFPQIHIPQLFTIGLYVFPWFLKIQIHSIL